MSNKKLAIFIFAIMLFLVVPVVSAVKIDYTPNDAGVADMEAHIEDTILFGLIQVGEQGTFELKSHKSPTDVLDVGMGWDVDMYYDVNFKDAQSGALGNVTFIDMRTGKEVDREWKFVYWGTETYEEPVYDCSENTLSNGTIIQECSQTGTQTKTRETWIDYNSRDLPKGKIRLGVMVNNKYNDYIDGIWEVQDKKIDKHASWSSSWETNMKAWYDVDEPSGAIVDNHSTNDGTNSGATQGVTGKLGQAIETPGSSSNYAYFPDLNLGNDFTVGFWFYQDSFAVGDSNHVVLNQWNDNGGSNERSWYIAVPSTSATLALSSSGSNEPGNSVSASYSFSEDTWYFIVATKSGTNATMYIEGVPVNSNTVNSGVYNSALDVRLGRAQWGGADRYSSVRADTIFFLTRAMSATEILNIYNGDFGCAYRACVSVAPDVSLIYPTNLSTFSIQNITFSGNVSSDTLENVTLIIDGVYNETNSSGIAGIYNFSKILSDGTHTFNYEACDLTDCSNGTEITFTIDTTPFVEFIPPTLPDYSNITNESIPIYVNVSTDYFFNISYDLYNENGTQFNQYYETETFDYNFTNIPDGHYHYNVTVCTTTGKCNVTETRHVNHDVTPPEINITSPSGTYDYLYVGETLDLNFTATDEVANVSECWYDYNGTNISVACTNGTLINANFILELNNNNLTVYSNDTFGNLGSEFVSWDYKVLETSKDYNNETLEGTFETFKLYLTKGAGVNVQNVVLHYDGQTDTSSLFSSGSDVRAEYELFINDVSADTNNTFYFTVTLADSTVFNTSSAVQLVRNIEIDDCSSQPNLFLTLNLVDEANQSAITGNIETYLSIINPDNYEEVLSFNDSYSSVSSKTFCSNIFLNESSFLLGAKIRYDADNHSAEFYNIQRSDLSNYPKTYILYDLKDDDTTKFKLIYRGENLVGVEGAIIQLQREYISEKVYKIVEAPLTSSDSTAVVHIDTNTNSYKATVVKDGVLLNTFDNLVFICQSELTGECTLDLQDYIVPPNSVPIETIQDFSYSITSSIDNKTITLDYSVPSGTTSDIEVVATQKDIVGTDTICNTTVSSAGGSIECGYNESIQDSYISYNIYKDGVQIAQKSYIVKDDLRDDFGGDNYFILIIFTISLIFMAILSPEWIVLNAVIAVIIGGVTWLVRGMDFVLGLGAVAWLLLGAIIIIIKMAQKEDQ